MKISCNVIKDLLPLYIENIASKDTRSLVEEHITECPDCEKELESLKEPRRFPPDTNTDSLRAIKRKVNRKRWKAVILAASIVLTIAIAAFSYLTTPEYIPYSEGLISFSETPDGFLYLTFNNALSGYDGIGSYPSPNNPDHEIVYLTLWTDKFEDYSTTTTIRKRAITLDKPENIDAIYYYIEGVEDTLIYGTDQYPDGGVMTLPRLVLIYYLQLAVLSAIVGIALRMIFRKKEKLKKIIEKILFLPVSYIIGHICIKGFATMSYSTGRDFILIVLITIPIYAALLFVISLYREKKKTAN